MIQANRSGLNISIPIRYFIYIPKLNRIKHSETLSSYWLEYLGNTDQFLAANSSCACFPVPVEMALAIGWLTHQEVMEGFDIPELAIAALKISGLGARP